MTHVSDIQGDPNYVPVLDYGFVGLVDIMGDDEAIAAAARCSYGKGTKSVNDDRNLIRYLIRHQHTSPIEMVELKLHLKMPIFVMRQHVRHRTASLNEYSGRYSEMTDEMYHPEGWRFQVQSANNKQASGDTLTAQNAETCSALLRQSYDTSYENYVVSLECGLSRELSRIQLPVANYTELYWKIDLKNFLHYTNLRNDPHAQYEIREYARVMYDMIKPHVPITCEAFEDYWSKHNTAHMSRMEVDLLKQIISREKWCSLIDMYESEDGVAATFGLTKREINELKEKLGL